MKCTKLILSDSKKCVDSCPSGYSEPQWSTESELMGRVCKKISMSNSFYAVFIGILCGAILCLLVVLVGVFIFRRKQQKIQKKSIKESLIDEEYDRNEFLKQLDDLRPQAEYFLHMLNDTRKQIRKLHLSGDNTAAAKYYPIIRDLAKILILLNRPVELISGPPHDWKTLLMWAERILSQYKPQITQLIEFLQTPVPPPLIDARLTFSKHTTFKTPPPTISKGRDTKTKSSKVEFDDTLKIQAKEVKKRNSLSSTKPSDDIKHLSLPNQKSAIGSLISLQEFDSILQPTNPFGESFNHVQNYLATTATSGLSANSCTGSSLLLEEEFYKLGFRPQDEITTEL